MTDKRIIDGINVSDCKYHSKYHSNLRTCYLPCVAFGICSNAPNCYYKQLKRKEQECEELKEELNMNKHFVHDSNIESSKHCKCLEYYKQALKKIEEIADDYNRPQKTSQYYRDGFDEIQDIINKLGDNNDK